MGQRYYSCAAGAYLRKEDGYADNKKISMTEYNDERKRPSQSHDDRSRKCGDKVLTSINKVVVCV